MNGYSMLADSYKKILERQEQGVNLELIRKDIKVLEFLATCDDTEIYKLFDSGVFNDIVKAYCKRAMNNKGVAQDDISNVLRELNCLFSEMQAKDIMA